MRPRTHMDDGRSNLFTCLRLCTIILLSASAAPAASTTWTSDGDWFADRRGERRIGGRIAIAATARK